jgi:enamine deaminase RidA (YjgF/YER057c/UK114 family)
MKFDFFERKINMVYHNIDLFYLYHYTDKLSQLTSSLDDVILMQLFVKNMNDFSKVNGIYKKYFPANPPAR